MFSQVCVQVPADEADEAVAVCLIAPLKRRLHIREAICLTKVDVPNRSGAV